MEYPVRKQIRLSEFDYASNGAYFVTICTENRQNVLSELRRGDPCGRPTVALTELGKIAEQELFGLEQRYPVLVDQFTIMPDHIHVILWITAEPSSTKAAPALGRIVGAYKSLVLHQWRTVCNHKGQTMGKVWQRGFYEHVVRNQQDLEEIRFYIDTNPDRWLERMS